MSKAKGSRLERELFHIFHQAGWQPIHVAGSGSATIEAADLVAGKKGRVLAIECKSGKKARYITKKQIEELKIFSEKFGAEPWLAARFNNVEWLFLTMEDLRESKTGNNFVVDLKLAKEKGRKFEDLIR